MNDNIVEILKNRAIEIFKRGEVAIKTMDEVSEWDSVDEVVDNVVTATKFFGFVAESIAKAADDILDTVSNEEKLEAAVRAIDDLIKLPPWLEMLDGLAIRWLISTAYQAIVKKAF